MTAPPTATVPIPDTTRARRARRRSWRHLAITLPAGASDLLSLTRRLVLANLLNWGADPATAENVKLCASELVGNVFRHTGGPARLELTVRKGVALLQVSDTSTEPPGASEPDEDVLREYGKGLHIVKAVAREVSVEIHGWGKTVTASFELA